jgi:NAD(P)-dependent dehydrogenase (short-subunit alcohol dehydrogenase family)
VPASGNRLDGKIAVITGAASGIGASTARRFVDEGASVVLADLQLQEAEALAAELGTAVAVAVAVDVTDEDAVAAAVDLAVDRFGRLDVMVNNAGIVGVVGRIAETPAAAWSKTVAVLLDGVFHGMKHAARVMVPQGSGSIVSLSSIAGVMGGLGPHCYTACKHAIIGLTKSVASELAADGIRVNAVAPGNTATAMTAAAITGDAGAVDAAAAAIASMSPMKTAGLPSDIADAILFLASDEARVVTGHTLVVDAGQTTNGGNGGFHLQPPALMREAGRRDRFS